MFWEKFRRNLRKIIINVDLSVTYFWVWRWHVGLKKEELKKWCKWKKDQQIAEVMVAVCYDNCHWNIEKNYPWLKKFFYHSKLNLKSIFFWSDVSNFYIQNWFFLNKSSNALTFIFIQHNYHLVFVSLERSHCVYNFLWLSKNSNPFKMSWNKTFLAFFP